ncbi:MAG: hypothetical protein V4625_05830 [Pseudomonadota bacterium]
MFFQSGMGEEAQPIKRMGVSTVSIRVERIAPAQKAWCLGKFRVRAVGMAGFLAFGSLLNCSTGAVSTAHQTHITRR